MVLKKVYGDTNDMHYNSVATKSVCSSKYPTLDQVAIKSSVASKVRMGYLNSPVMWSLALSSRAWLFVDL